MNAAKRAEKAHKVYAIESGTVIDHIPHPMALKVVEILGVKQDGILTVGMNFPSQRLGRKDIVKVENLKLTAQVTDRLALVAPTATINIIEGSRVVEKRPIHVPKTFRGLLRCPNPNCITNIESVSTHFVREGSESEPAVRCTYCERLYREPAQLVV
ncbi:MAG: aspartate carbamoyltransferase regulatory subunit [Deltaproteobacteria bacterium]|nr:aspartate carbamoyltransferase regulatory subunit [Deltaproteobacteria bacterium]